MTSVLNKATKYAVLVLMLLVGGISPVLQTLDTDENLGITFPEPQLAARGSAVKTSDLSRPPVPVILSSFFPGSMFASQHLDLNSALNTRATGSQNPGHPSLDLFSLPLRS